MDPAWWDGRVARSKRRRRHLSVGVAAEVKSKLSVVEVVGETVVLKKAGTTYKGLSVPRREDPVVRGHPGP